MAGASFPWITAGAASNLAAMAGDFIPSPGDLVLVHDPDLARQLQRDGEIGVVINTRRGSARVIFLRDRKTFWIDDHRLFPRPPEAASPAAAAVATALRVIEPEEAEIDGNTEIGWEIQALALEFGVEHLARLSAALGPRLRRWDTRPYGMALITVVLNIAGDP